MQLEDLQLNTLYFMVYDDTNAYSTNDIWFINEFHSRPNKEIIAGICVASSWPLAVDLVYLSASDLERVVVCVAIDDINTIHETHPHLFI